MTTTAAPDLERQLVAGLRREKQVIAEAEIRRLTLVVEWAQLHQAPLDHDPQDVGFGSRYLSLAGPGAPLVEEFAVTDLAASLGMSDHAGRALVAQVLELRYRLPRLWRRVNAGKVATWKATGIAVQTRALTPAGAAYVDEQLAHVVAGAKPTVIDRLVAEAVIRFDPATAAAEARKRAERRHVAIEGNGVFGELDQVDALDLEQAIRTVATELLRQGSTETLDVRRAKALGEIARTRLALDPTVQPVGRGVDLVVHVTPGSPVARLENTQTAVEVDTIRGWCAAAARVTLRPVVDLNEAVHVTQYEVPDRLRRRVAWRDQHCVFPHCDRSAARCDLDHVIPYDTGGPTSTENLAPLCRRHHRAKTFGDFTYRVLGPGAYEWTLPSGWRVLRDHHGTHPPVPPDPPEE